MPPQAQKEWIEITARILSIPVAKDSQYNEGKVWCVINSSLGKLTGEVDKGSVLCGCDYRLSGYWEENNFGKSFKFKSLCIREPSSRHGVVAYLSKYCSWIGAVVANRLCDKFGVDTCIGRLRESPEEVAASDIGLNLERCKAASIELKRLSAFEDTRVKLMDLFDKRGFRSTLIDQLIEKFGSSAAETVRGNPFVLLENKFAGCGFNIVDQLYQSLGLDPAWMGRQVYALVFVLENLPDSSTWGRRAEIYTQMGKHCSKGLQMTECINEAVRLNKIKVRIEPPANEMWIATKEQADQESMIAERLWEIGGVGLLGAKEEKIWVPVETTDDEMKFLEPCQIDDLLADHEPQRTIDRLTMGLLSAKPKPDIRDTITPIPDAMQKIEQDDSLMFEVDASDEDDDESYEVATELVEELDGLLERLQEIDAAVDFFESVSERLAGISENIERKKSATQKQITALQNMASSCEVWLENRENRKDRW